MSIVEFCFETINWSPFIGFEKSDPIEMVQAAAGSGYRWISFDLPTVQAHLQHGGDLANLRAEMDLLGLGTLALHSLTIDENVAGVKATADEAVGYATALGARYLNTGVTTTVDARVIEAARAVDAACRRADVQFTTEFFSFLPVSSIQAARQFVQRAGVTGPSIVLDAWHFFTGLADFDALEQLDPGEIAYVQFSDHSSTMSSDLFHEALHERKMPGEGAFDLSRFVNTLQARGFDGIVGPEILSRRTRSWPLPQYAAAAMESTRRYWVGG